MLTASARCHVEEITPFEAAVLADRGLLPGQAEHVTRMCSYRGTERIPPAELTGIRFLVHYDRGDVTGMLAFRDAHDLHASRTMRHALHLAGSPRACWSLVQALHAGAERDGLPLRAESSAENVRMDAFYDRMGWTLDRHVWVHI